MFVGLKVNTFHVTEGVTGGFLVRKGVIKNFSIIHKKAPLNESFLNKVTSRWRGWQQYLTAKNRLILMQSSSSACNFIKIESL